MRVQLLIAAVAGMAFVSQAHADGGAYNDQPSDAYNALGPGAVDLSGATLNKTQLSQAVSGVTINAYTDKLGAGGLSTSGVQGSALSSTAGVIVQETNTGVASNIGVANTVSVGTVNLK